MVEQGGGGGLRAVLLNASVDVAVGSLLLPVQECTVIRMGGADLYGS